MTDAFIGNHKASSSLRKRTRATQTHYQPERGKVGIAEGGERKEGSTIWIDESSIILGILSYMYI